MSREDLAGLTDDELMSRLAAGGEDRYLRAIVLRYKDRLLPKARRLLRDFGLAEDALQETFVKIFMNARRYRPGNFSAWISRILTHEAWDIVNQRKRERSLDLDTRLAAETDFADPLFAERFRKTLEQLEPCQRICLSLYYLEGRKYKQIAADIGYSPRQVKTCIQNGRKRFKTLWRQNDPGS
jgi:RNA polymerase sigma-70 factor (ECF subfamily)